jgi:hypothetical protein
MEHQWMPLIQAFEAQWPGFCLDLVEQCQDMMLAKRAQQVSSSFLSYLYSIGTPLFFPTDARVILMSSIFFLLSIVVSPSAGLLCRYVPGQGGCDCADQADDGPATHVVRLCFYDGLDDRPSNVAPWTFCRASRTRRCSSTSSYS